ncbi:hypothetical protein BKA81DRAFT_139206 [Phyllosticta paracitricarpa]|uniref:Secreted protein n=1 Tax=Phyllosticta paracitricarpa TaxID=2016321 RepID=A0ABR1N9R4_9PEZI
MDGTGLFFFFFFVFFVFQGAVSPLLARLFSRVKNHKGRKDLLQLRIRPNSHCFSFCFGVGAGRRLTRTLYLLGSTP